MTGRLPSSTICRPRPAPAALLLAGGVALWAAPPVSAEDASDQDPCLINAPRLTPGSDEGDALDWTRSWLYRSVCSSAYWFDSFFGEERFDDAARGVRGNLFLVLERRKGEGVKFKPGLRVRVPFPNLSKRFDLLFDRDDEQTSIEGRGDAGGTSPATQVRPPGDQESTQASVGYRMIQEIDELFNLRAGVRLRDARLRPFVQSRYRKDFWRTDITQWHFTETLFWRSPDGFGESTALDFEAALAPTLLFRWFNSGTIAQSTEGLAWQSGISLYKDLGEGRAVQGSLSASGDTGKQGVVGNFGPRLSYRQTLGRPWLFGEGYVGIDHPRGDNDPTRRTVPFAGVRWEIHFGK